MTARNQMSGRFVSSQQCTFGKNSGKSLPKGLLSSTASSEYSA
jgi:hypothetical protein